MQKKELFLTHSHTHYSNIRLRDAINKVEGLLDYSLELGLRGVVVTDHEVLSAHVKAHQYINEHKERFGDFVIGYGNEIYLVDENKVQDKRAFNERIPFYHFILIAKTQKGYEGLKKLSSKAWENEFFYKGLQRVPTYKHDLEEIMKEYKGHIIASTACVGGELPQTLINHHYQNTNESRERVHKFVMWLINLFGEDLYFELQPSHISEEQKIANNMLDIVAGVYGVKKIVATDAHYLSKHQQIAHRTYLSASEGDREVDAFYSTAYVMNRDELLEYFPENKLDEMILNTHEIADKLEPISFEQKIKVPKANIPDFEPTKLFIPYYMEYEFIRKFAESNEVVDHYYLYLLAEGMKNKNQELNKENLTRIETELKEIYLISEALKQPLSSYFVLTKDLIDVMWEISLVGVSRGSASCYYTNYLLDIVQINPLKHDLPHWRFLTHHQATLPDIDIDTEGSKRLEIIRLTKERYGEDNVLNMGTFITEGSRSAVLTSCRGLDVDKDVAQYISSLIPSDKSDVWAINDCFYGNPKKNRKPAKNFIAEVEKIEGLKMAILAIDGLVSGRGQHASGVVIFPNGYISQNALMKTSSGLKITQFDADDSAYMGALKLDFLSISALERIRTAMELLLKDGKIQWQGSLRATYNKYFHPDVLDMETPQMFEMLVNGDVLNAFQFETAIGTRTISKINPRSFLEICAGNSLMRLTTDGEQPLDKYIRFKADISQWYSEMKEHGLNDDEIKTLEDHLLPTYGICDTQEGLMLISLDKNISNFNLTQANKFRKAVAKKDEKLIEKQREIFFEFGLGNGAREIMLHYVWEKLLKPQFG